MSKKIFFFLLIVAAAIGLSVLLTTALRLTGGWPIVCGALCGGLAGILGGYVLMTED